MNNDIENKREILEQRLETMWNFYDEIEMYVGDKESSDEVPDFSSFAQSAIKEPKDVFLEMIDTSNIHQIGNIITKCTRCSLSDTRIHAVPGKGVINAKVMIIGEGPGEAEDKSGEPFVGKSGAYLDTWLKAISLDRNNDVFITNVVKCRPPENRNPTLEEMNICAPYLDKQIALIKPEVILCLGKVASLHLLKKTGTLSSLRGTFHHYQHTPLLVTYHPSAVLRNSGLRKDVWQDLQMLAKFLQLSIQQKGNN